MGRKPKPVNERLSGHFAFRYNPYNIQFPADLEKAYTIMRLEKKTLGTIFTEALNEYVQRHHDHAFQQNLTTYTEDSPGTTAKQEQDLVELYTSTPHPVNIDTIRNDLTKIGYRDPKRRGQATIRIKHALATEGVEVIQ